MENRDLKKTTNLNKNRYSKHTAIGVIHRTYVTQLKNAHIHTASTKTKAEVRGGGRKPRPQKGQGYARSGSIRSPLWVGGGVIFGPKPHLTRKKINKKEKQLGIMATVLLKQFKQSYIIRDEQFNEFIDPNLMKTKNIAKFLSNFGIKLKLEKILFILSKPNQKFWLISRNLKNITVTTVDCLNVKDLLYARHIFVKEECFRLIYNKYWNKKFDSWTTVSPIDTKKIQES